MASQGDSATKQYLVIANKTLSGAPLAEAIATLLQLGDCQFHIVVPATPARDHLALTDPPARVIAERRLAHAIAVLRASGAVVDGEVGDASPVVAAANALRRRPYDEIVVSTLPPGVSRWLKMDLPTRLQRLFKLPVHHVITTPVGPNTPLADD